MRTLFWMVVLVTFAVLVAFVIHQFPGNVLIVVDQWRIQVSLAFAILLLIGSFSLCYLLIRVLTWLAYLPQRYRGWQGQRQEKREQSLLEQGWTALLEGRYIHAEKNLGRLAERSSDKRRQVLATLSAARAAHELGEFKRQDRLLEQAQSTAASQVGDVELNTAVAAAAADLWLQQGRAEQALGALQVDHVQPMRHMHTMRLLLRVYQQTGHHTKVLELARALQRKKALSQSQAEQLIEAAASALIMQSQGDEQDWMSCWKALNPEERRLPNVALAGAQAFQAVGNYKQATSVLEAAMSSAPGRYNPSLLAAYAKAEPEQVTPRLQKAEQWLQDRMSAQQKPSNRASSVPTDEALASHAALLTTLGSLCLAAQMWGQAQRYLEQSAALRPDARVHALLGSLFDRIGQPQRAAQHWRLATAVSAALPTLVQDAVLPAANTDADPVIPHSEGLGVFEEEAAGTAALQETKSTVSKVGASVHAPYEEFFDSAPIPMGHFESIDGQTQDKTDESKRQPEDRAN